MSAVAPDFLVRKLDKRFDMLDADGSGYLEAADFQSIARRFLAYFSVPDDNERAQAVLSAYEELWTALSGADADGDGRIVRQEFRDRLLSADFQEGDAVEATFGRVVAACNVITDVDGDGLISYPEFRHLPGLAELTEDECRSAFGRMDRDGDGGLSVEEIKRGVAEFYTSSDPDAPGNWMFGKV
ncbi:EF-hand domain-containing protein [Longispora albida]|uniref:EF-hand domain-containing protein n=1 Tax=Longispora albida TaxID=203523 RepID=UPI000378DFBC|nr:EF-hand domain-containing protein [Longispora albida]